MHIKDPDIIKQIQEWRKAREKGTILQRGFVQAHSIEQEAAYDGPAYIQSQSLTESSYESQSVSVSQQSNGGNSRPPPPTNVVAPPPLPDRPSSRNGIISKTNSMDDYPGPPPGRPPPSRTEALKAISSVKAVPKMNNNPPPPSTKPPEITVTLSQPGPPRPPPMSVAPKTPPLSQSQNQSPSQSGGGNRLSVRPARNNLLAGIRGFSKEANLKAVDPSDARRSSVQPQDMQNMLKKSLDKYREFVMDEQDGDDDNEEDWSAD